MKNKTVKMKNPERHIYIKSFHSGTPHNPYVEKRRLWQLEQPFRYMSVDMGYNASFLESYGKKSTKKGVKR